MKLLLLYLLLINAAALLSMLADKQKAKKNHWRIPEKQLLLLAAAGGSLGCCLGMRLFRHKTKHLAFTLGVPLLMAVQAVALILLWPIIYP